MPPNQRARNLRSDLNLPEVLLWQVLRRSQTGFKIRRQVPIGGFILDFFCSELSVAVEVDGKNHDVRSVKDLNRDEVLAEAGIKTLRIPAFEVLKSPRAAAEKIRLFLELERSKKAMD